MHIALMVHELLVEGGGERQWVSRSSARAAWPRSHPLYLSLPSCQVFFRNVTFAGKVADEEMQDFYCACDAFLFPNENQMWVQAVLEAMAYGCPAETSSASFFGKGD